MSDMLAGALALANAGRFVFPVHPNTKAPLVAGGFKSATTDFDQLQDWWERFPDANIGLATRPSRLLVIDIDRKNGVDGMFGLAKVTLKYKRDPFRYAREARTPSGGHHLYFNDPGGVSPSQGKFGKHNCPGVDIRAGESCITVPPSAGYEWANKHPVGDLPDELIEPLQWQPDDTFSLSRAPWLASNERTTSQSVAYSMATLRHARGRVASAGPGQRNAQLFKEAATLGEFIRSGSLGMQQVVDELLGACDENGLLKEGKKSCLKTIESGLKASAK